MSERNDMSDDHGPGDIQASERGLAPSYPRYLDLIERGILGERIARAREFLASCNLCPRNCGVNRLENERGLCGVGEAVVVSSAHPHFGEEAPLVGKAGSGTIFFSGCNLQCIFCQNYEISRGGAGAVVSSSELAEIMLRLQEIGCHNLNLVTPTHVVPQILESLGIAVQAGFSLPIVYNTGGYDSPRTLELLNGVVDIYMPDFKYLSRDLAKRYSNAEDYPEVITAAVREMHRQVGDLAISDEGIATAGLLVRHLVMPGSLDDTTRILHFLAGEISRDTYINVMRQYHPCDRAFTCPPLDRPITHGEWREAIEAARGAGLHRLDKY
jgi:putative pyruvate formate lyase activating enzyme